MAEESGRCSLVYTSSTTFASLMYNEHLVVLLHMFDTETLHYFLGFISKFLPNYSVPLSAINCPLNTSVLLSSAKCNFISFFFYYFAVIIIHKQWSLQRSMALS